MKNLPEISIITVNLNNSLYLKDTIESVLNQNSIKNQEYIIIDGNSTDNSIEIIKSYLNKFKLKGIQLKWISEKDNGLYDAMNKGIKISKGKIIGFLNSGDIFKDHTVVSEVLKTFNNKKIDSLYGDLEYVKKNNINKTVRYWKSGQFNKSNFLKGWMCPHLTFFVKKNIYNKYGIFNTDFKISADYEIILRFLYKYNISTYYLNKVLIKMRTGGISNNSFRNRLLAFKENKKAWNINKLKIKWYTIFLKRIIKLKQFIVKN
jgi:glycosyltransferase involved in cell wall biosynthesis